MVFLIEVAAAALAFLYHDEIVGQVEDVLRDEGISKYRDDPDWHDFVNWVQEEVSAENKLCLLGMNGYLMISGYIALIL